MKNLEIAATRLMGKAITKNYAAKKAMDPRMQKIFSIINAKCVMAEGKIYRQKNGIAYGDPVGWYDAERMTGWMDKKAWKQVLHDEDKPAPSYDDEEYDFDNADIDDDFDIADYD